MISDAQEGIIVLGLVFFLNPLLKDQQTVGRIYQAKPSNPRLESPSGRRGDLLVFLWKGSGQEPSPRAAEPPIAH